MRSGRAAHSQQRLAVITGSDRGIGFEVAHQLGIRGYRVVLTGPNEARLASALRRLQGKGVEAHVNAHDYAQGRVHPF